MHSARNILIAISAVILLSLGTAQIATAAEPGPVTVRVEGFGGTLLAQTTVTTSVTPVPYTGGTCRGTSAAGALYDAVHGNWLVRAEGAGAELDGILGQNLPALEEAGNYAYWAIVLNNEFAGEGACTQEVNPGADLVFVGVCYGAGELCPSGGSSPGHVLTATAPRARILVTGESVSETIGSLNIETFEADAAPPAGTTLDAGSLSAAPGPGGVATLTFTAPGTYTVQAHAPDSAPSDPYIICVHDPGSGSCEAPTPGSTGVAGFTTTSAPYKGPFALVADVTSLLDGHVYGRGHAPRLISGRITSHSPVNAVSLALRRSYRGRCYGYDGLRGRFARSRCGGATFFSVSKEGSFSYLLPAALPPGRYVLDVKAGDVAGNATALARGTSRLVFYVR